MYSKTKTKKFMKNYSNKIEKLKELINLADAVVIGAGSGLSTVAGFEYDGERFERYFADFKQKYGIEDMYTGGFYQYPKPEEYWAFWSRNIWINRYAPALKDTYNKLFDLIKDKNYFVITTNVDHQFQKAGFDKKRLFYTQGDYGLFESAVSSVKHTYNNYEAVRKMILAQGFKINEDGSLGVPADVKLKVPTEFIPKIDHLPAKLNLRIDDTFVEDEGWRQSAERYQEFLKENMFKKVLYLELGVGMNTPAIIKYPFWQLTLQNLAAHYASVNQGEIMIAEQILDRSIGISADIDVVLDELSM